MIETNDLGQHVRIGLCPGGGLPAASGKALEPFLMAASRVGRAGANGRIASRAAAAPSREQNQAIREWAVKNGFEVCRSVGISRPRSSRRSTPNVLALRFAPVC